MSSPDVGDQIMSVLMRLRNRREAVRKIVASIAVLKGAKREAALGQFLVLSGLRRLEDLVEREVSKVPALYGLLEHRVLGREYKKGLKQGHEEGREEGKVAVIRGQLAKRFGKLPAWADSKLANAKAGQLELWGERLLDAATLKHVFADELKSGD